MSLFFTFIRFLFWSFASALLLAPTTCLAYLGPGVGTGTIGVVLGVLGAIFLALFSILWYPIKRLIKSKKKPTAPAEENKET